MRAYSRQAANGSRKSSQQSSLLILRFDAEKLKRDGLQLADETRFISQVTRLIGTRVELISATDTSDLLCQLGKLVQTEAHFDIVVVIGHANDLGIQIAIDRFSPWKELAEFLQPFAPRRLMLIACQAGCHPAVLTLFRQLPKLRRVYAASANVSRDLAAFMLGFLLYLTPNKVPKGDAIRIAQAVAFAITGTFVREWRRGIGREIRVNFFDDFAEKASHRLQ